ncbi:MAG: hypothetical protein IPM21_02060 [Acidobacteria bacterium]|nr:hypothetical protein [Acidobacteriota bacterium]
MPRYFIVLFLFVALMVVAPVPSFGKGKSEVLVLGTLHQFHEKTSGYSFADLSRIIETIKPDILATELTPEALENRSEQKTKQEYQRSIFPLLEKHGYLAIPMEPAEPEYSRLVGIFRASSKEFNEKFPQKSEAFSVYSNQLYEYLFEKWKSAEAVNSDETDALFEVKHEFQNALFGPNEEAAWDGWNSHFLKQILAAAKQHPGKRVLVLVGVEHTYWLRKELKASAEVRYVPVGGYLK